MPDHQNSMGDAKNRNRRKKRRKKTLGEVPPPKKAKISGLLHGAGDGAAQRPGLSELLAAARLPF